MDDEVRAGVRLDAVRIALHAAEKATSDTSFITVMGMAHTIAAFAEGTEAG